MGLKDTELKKLFCLCMHGHFYQPPRDNPSLEIIEVQESAFPSHDWNERVTSECYGPNTRARVHGDKGLIKELVNNYSYMSFDFGPTLLSWLETSHPWIYSQILAADKEGQKRYNGHGNALAHVYNHMIMPLATSRDKLTQIRWGLADFRHRFGREAEGMWLAETAVDMETLGLMADEGVRFTILSPDQALATRIIDHKRSILRDVTPKDQPHPGSTWIDVKGGRIDPSRPYRVFLDKGTGKYIDVFFYDGPLSRSIAYEKILSSGEALMGRIKGILEHHKEGPRILSIATDGESYGHHFKFGEMALAWLFNKVERDEQIKLVNFGYFLELSPPQQEAKIIDKSSWSCAHGVERWRSDCGCSVSGKKEWNQKWRAPLRDGLDWLSKELSVIFEKRAGRLLKNPWDARNDYIKVLLSDSDLNSFFKNHSIRHLSQDEKTEILCLMESQRMALYMFTSCGWFFDDISGIESIQILMYASRAIDLVRRSSPNDLEKGLIDFLVLAESNNPSYKNGARIYEVFVKRTKITPSLVAAHYAIMSLLDGVNIDDTPFSKMILPLRQNKFMIDGIKAVLGEVQTTEIKTGKKAEKTFFAVRGKDQEFDCVIGKVSASDYEHINNEITSSLAEAPESLMTVFSMKADDVQYFTLGDLIADVRLGVIKSIADSLYNKISSLMVAEKAVFDEFISVLNSIKMPPPSHFIGLFKIFFAEILSGLLIEKSDERLVDFNTLFRFKHPILSEFPQDKSGNGSRSMLSELMDEPVYKTLAQGFLLKSMKQLAESKNPIIVENVINLLNLANSQGVVLGLWECQNIFYDAFIAPESIRKSGIIFSSILSELGPLLGFQIEDK
jgi:alpha-amylase/alpha-mannosidase (GH57 family)